MEQLNHLKSSTHYIVERHRTMCIWKIIIYNIIIILCKTLGEQGKIDAEIQLNMENFVLSPTVQAFHHQSIEICMRAA